MKILVFIPSYNDTITAYRLSLNFIKENVDKVLIIDESDDPRCIAAAKKIKHEKIDIVCKNRSGKYSAWRAALEQAKNYDGLIEVDADIKIRNPRILISSLENYDVVTAHQKFIIPKKGLGRVIGKIYQGMHQELKKIGKFNMGGQIIALSKTAVLTLLSYEFFREPVLADDHVICLGAYVLGLKCKTVECGLDIGLPSNLKEWVKYRSRHRKAIKWSEQYVAKKTGKVSETAIASRSDFKLTLRYFLKNLIKYGNVISPLILILFGTGMFLPAENPTKWSSLKSEKLS